MGVYVFTDVTFEIEGQDYSCPVTRAEFTNTPNILEANTLCGPAAAVGRTRYALELEASQDWFEAASLAQYLYDNEGILATATLTWVSPDESATVTGVGEVRLVAPGFGGTAEELAAFSVSMPVEGKPDIDVTPGS